MFMVPERHAAAYQRACQYAERHALTFVDSFGGGQDGLVLTTTKDRHSAVKALRYGELYARERDVYIRLRENDVDAIAGFNVPRLIEHDDSLWILEMEIVVPPFVVDFAGAYLDRRPPYTEEEMNEIEDGWEELFEHRWPQVQVLLAGFRRHRIYLNDVKFGNITFGDEGTTQL